MLRPPTSGSSGRCSGRWFIVKPHKPPTREGFFWAKLIHPTRMPAKEDWTSTDWEVVQVVDNNGDGDERLGVCVFGIGPYQWIPDFVWGTEVIRPQELN